MLEQSKEFELDSTITASCEHTNESLGSIKGGNFLTTWATTRFSISTALHRLNQSICQSVSQSCIHVYLPNAILCHLFGGSFNIILWTTSRSLKWSLPFRISDKNSVGKQNFSHACYMPCPSKPPWFDHPNNDLWAVQAYNSSLYTFSQTWCHFLPLTSQYSSQHHIHTHIPYVFFP